MSFSQASARHVTAFVLALGLATCAALAAQSGPTASPVPAQAPSPVPAHQAPAAPPHDKTAGEYYKNIQILKDIPADQLLPTMQFVAASLGVECEHCHVGRDFDKDDKQPKKTARQMMQMMFAIDKDNFKGHQEVTCQTCHHGSADPVSIPVIPEQEPKPEAEQAAVNPAKAAAAIPPPDHILAKWVEAVGGADTIQKISSRVEKGTIHFGDRQMAVEIFAKAPDKRLTVTHAPNGESKTAFDGHSGWMSGMGPPRRMTEQESEAFRLDADFYFPLHVKQVFPQFRTRPAEKIKRPGSLARPGAAARPAAGKALLRSADGVVGADGPLHRNCAGTAAYSN